MLVSVNVEWIALGLTVAGMIWALGRDRQKMGSQIERCSDRVGELHQAIEAQARRDKRQGARLLTRIEDLERAYSLLGLSEEERAKRAALPRVFVPRPLALEDPEEN